MKKILSGFVLACLSVGAFAQTSAQTPASVHEAFKACRESTPKGADGKPDKAAIKSCMQSKGVTITPEMKQAIKACREQEKSSGGKPAKGAMKECLESKKSS